MWAGDGATGIFGVAGLKGVWEWEVQGDCRDLQRQHRPTSRGRRPRDRVGGRPSGSGSSGIDGSIGQPRRSGCADWRNDGSDMAHGDKSRVARWERSSGAQALAPSTPGCAPGRNRWRTWSNAVGGVRERAWKRRPTEKPGIASFYMLIAFWTTYQRNPYFRKSMSTGSSSLFALFLGTLSSSFYSTVRHLPPSTHEFCRGARFLYRAEDGCRSHSHPTRREGH